MTAYADLDDLKRYLRIPGVYDGSINTEEDTTDDILLNLALESASRAIDTACNRTFGILSVVDTGYFTARYHEILKKYVIDIYDLMDDTGLVITVDGEVVTEYTLYPLNAALQGKPYTMIALEVHPTDPVEVEALWGWSAVPDAIRNATLLQAARLFKRRDAPFGIAGSADLGSELRLLAKVDPDVDLLCRSYRRWWGAA